MPIIIKRLYLLSLSFIILLLFCETSFAKEFIAFSKVSGDYWQIWMMGADGKNQHQLTYSPQDKHKPVWSPDGSKIIFHTNNGQLFTVNRDGTGEERVLIKFNNVQNADWSKNSDQIIFVHNDPLVGDVADIWKSDIKGEKPVLLTKDAKFKYHPAFSLKGDKIVFAKTENSRRHIWVMDADGQNQRNVTDMESIDVAPSFSPDGEHILFASDKIKDDNFELFLSDLEGKKLTQITNNPGLDTNPCFSPDGKKIAFVSNRSGSQQIWVIQSDGSNPIALTQGPVESIDPSWVNIAEKKEP